MFWITKRTRFANGALLLWTGALLVLVLGVSLGVLVRPARPGAGPVAVGTVIEVRQPTGVLVAGADGGKPQPTFVTTTLRVLKRADEARTVPHVPTPWHLTIDGVRYVAGPVE